MRYLAACCGLLLAMTDIASAVIISTGDGTGNTTAPVNDPGFANVGIRGSGTAVYLGDGWVLTAAHVGDGSTMFNNVWYNEVAGSAVQLANPPGAGFTTDSDLLLYQIANPPDLPSVNISSSAATVGWQVTMIGAGRDRSNSQLAYWDSSWEPSSTPSTYAGEIWAATSEIRWGTNIISSAGFLEGVNANSEKSFATTFAQNGTAFEAQGAPGDSGGAVFHQEASGVWDLAGVMFSISTATGQPWGTSVFGNVTYSADLSAYRNEIYQLIGIPGDVNHDGIVNGLDLSIVASNWLKMGSDSVGLPGDANHDGVVNGLDLSLIASNWDTSLSSGLSGSNVNAMQVPEPSTVGLAITSAALIVCVLSFKRAKRAWCKAAGI
ncbi:MAG TPA: dockerin type I domain-containing protein [Pirellulales bacterium]|jgi:hypothetical protein